MPEARTGGCRFRLVGSVVDCGLWVVALKCYRLLYQVFGPTFVILDINTVYCTLSMVCVRDLLSLVIIVRLNTIQQ